MLAVPTIDASDATSRRADAMLRMAVGSSSASAAFYVADPYSTLSHFEMRPPLATYGIFATLAPSSFYVLPGHHSTMAPYLLYMCMYTFGSTCVTVDINTSTCGIHIVRRHVHTVTRRGYLGAYACYVLYCSYRPQPCTSPSVMTAPKSQVASFACKPYTLTWICSHSHTYVRRGIRNLIS